MDMKVVNFTVLVQMAIPVEEDAQDLEVRFGFCGIPYLINVKDKREVMSMPIPVNDMSQTSDDDNVCETITVEEIGAIVEG